MDKLQIGGELESIAQGNIVTRSKYIYDETKGEMQSVINQETNAELVRIDEAKQNNLTFDQTPTEESANPVTSGGVYAADAALQQAIEAILLLIPSAASALNQLADKSFVNSSVSTATATFRGTYNLVTDLGLMVSATHQQIATALVSVVSTADNNDYCFVQIPVSDQSSDIRVTERYKFDGTAWSYEYDLNNSGFTADQWAAINSGITSALVGKLGALPTVEELAVLFNGKQNVLTFDNVPTAGSNNPVKSGGLYEVFAVINAMIPTGADANNKLVAENRLVAYVTSVIEALDASYNITTGDGHVTLRLTQVNGAITSLQIATDDIASATALTALGERVSMNERDIDNLQAAYEALTQSDIVVVNGALPSSGQQQNIIYRQPDQDHTPPQFYSDYMWNGTTWVLMATYNNAIDPRPKKGSQNLVTSGGVFDNMGALDVSELNATENPHTLATYADRSAAIAAIPSDYKKGGMSIKYVQTSDNKYVQARCMAQNFTTDVTQWQGVDTKPTVGSKNLVESDGALKSSINILYRYDNYIKGKYIDTSGSSVDITSFVASANLYCIIIDCSHGDVFKVTGKGGNAPRLWAFIDDSGNILSVASKNADETDFILEAPANTSKLIVNVNKTVPFALYKFRDNYKTLLSENQYFTEEEKTQIYANLGLNGGDSVARKDSNIPITSAAVYNTVHNGIAEISMKAGFTVGGYYNINGDVGDTISTINVVANTNMAYIAIPCNAGDVFSVYGKGMSSYALYALLDGNNKIKAVLKTYNETRNRQIIAYSDGTLYVSVNKNYLYDVVKIASIEDRNTDYINLTEGIIATALNISSYSNCKLLVFDKIDLGGNTANLQNIELVACGGIIVNGTISGKYKITASDYEQIFDNTINLSGNCQNKYLSICWFGAIANAYLKDDNVQACYNKKDSTIYIQKAIDAAYSSGVNRIYVPPTDGAYFVRCQIEKASQDYTGNSAIFGMNAALYIYDGTELFGGGENSKLVVVDYLSSSEATIEKYKTQQLIALADYSDADLNVPLLDTSVYATAIEAINADASPYMHKKYYRDNVDIHHLFLSTRKVANGFNSVSKGHAIAINLCANILTGAEISDKVAEKIKVHDCFFYDVVQAIQTNNSYGGYTEDGQSVISIIAYNNHIDTVNNKAIEFGEGSIGSVAEYNKIYNASCGLQEIFKSKDCVFRFNTIQNCIDGINITQEGSNVRVEGNYISGCDYPIKFRSDAANWDGMKVIENVMVLNNVFISNIGKSPLTFEGHNLQASNRTGVLNVKNVYISNNIFFGGNSYLGCIRVLNKNGYQSWLIEDIVCDKNVWNCNVQIINSVVTSGSRPSSVVQNIIFKDMVQSGKTLKIDNASAYLLDVLNHGTIDASAGTILVNRVLNQ